MTPKKVHDGRPYWRDKGDPSRPEYDYVRRCWAESVRESLMIAHVELQIPQTVQLKSIEAGSFQAAKRRAKVIDKAEKFIIIGTPPGDGDDEEDDNEGSPKSG